MSRNLRAALSAMMLASGCAAESLEPTGAAEAAQLGARPARMGAPAYFLGRRDVRRCRFPLCGGYFVRAANLDRLRCGDGTMASECYVALLDDEALGGVTLDGFGAGEMVLRGALSSGDAGEFGTYPLLRVDAAFRAVRPGAPSGTLYLVADSGIRCITTPCPSLVARPLNGAETLRIAELTLDGLGDAQRDELAKALFDGGAIAAGPRPGGGTLAATQLYLPLRAPEPGTCAEAVDCTLSFHRASVGAPSDCYCPTCPAPLDVATARRNETGWRRHCSESHGPNVCPAAPCAPPPEVTCAAGMCSYGGLGEE